MQIVKKPQPPQQTPAPTDTLPKTLPQAAQRTAAAVGQPAIAPATPAIAVQAEPQQVSVEPQVTQPPPQVITDFDDGILLKDPNTGQVMTSELDTVGVDIDALGGDPLRAIYQTLVWAADSLKKLAMTTPALAGLSPEMEKVIDGVATIGYQVTNTGAELTRGLWNWPFTRVVINEQLEQFIHPEAWGTFNKLYSAWYTELVQPVESGQAKYDPNKITGWVDKHKDEIADPKAFIRLCSQRYTMEKVAQKSAWMPTQVLSTTRPVGVRGTTTTGLEQVFKKKPG